jgi:hypothetical protein
MTQKLTKEEIAEIKRKRASDRRLMIDKLRFWVGVFSVPTILIMAYCSSLLSWRITISSSYRFNFNYYIRFN